MPSYLIPVLNVTSKLEGRQWKIPGGRFGWAAWEKRGEFTPTYGEARQNEDGEWEHFDYRPGRLVLVLDDGVDVADAHRAADALSALIDLASGPWGIQLTPLELPDRFAGKTKLFGDELEGELEQHDALQPMHMIGTKEVHISEDGIEWALDLLYPVLRDADADAGGGLLAALTFLFVSQLEFAFVGDDVRWVLGLKADEDAPWSAIDRVRIEESFHNCFKALEALLGGEPPTDERRLRRRLIEHGIDPGEESGFPGRPKETVLARVQRLQETRDKRSAHGGRTGVRTRKISFFELMDAQQATRIAIHDSLRSRIAALRTEQA